jgi:hypothetical protein
LVVLWVSGCQADDGAKTTLQVAETGPLDEYLARIGFGFGEMTRIEADLEMKRTLTLQQDMIAACMQEKGFEYSPFLGLWGFSASFEGDEWNIELGTRAFAEEYGFGISITHPSSLLQHGRDSDGELPENPNTALWEEMTEKEYSAWREAQLTCRIDAWYSTLLIETPYEFASLQEEVANFRQITLANDAEVVALDFLWRDCMTIAGFSEFRNREEALLNFRDELDETIFRQAQLYEDYGIFDYQPILTLRQRERETAVADWDCRAALEFDKRRQQIELQLQQQFVDRFGIELEAWAIHVESNRH